jgi:nucleoside-diphosphate-sugar epimerase
MDQSVFLAGGTGFIGRHLLERLSGRSAVRYLTRCRLALTGSSILVIGDLRGIDIVLHRGGVTGRAQKKDHFAVTVDGTRALLAAAAVPECAGS